MTERHGQLLEAGSLLHDIGYFISYDRHHKHTYHLVRHANLFGFTPPEREIIANIARYHRKAKPKKTHENFCSLSAEDHLLVRKLGGILRLSDGLDRRRNGQVNDIDCRMTNDTFEITLIGKGDLSVELYGAESKGDLFKTAFSCDLAVKTQELQ